MASTVDTSRRSRRSLVPQPRGNIRGGQGRAVEGGDHQVQEDGVVPEDMNVQDGEHALQDEQGHATHHIDLNKQAEDEDYHDEPGGQGQEVEEGDEVQIDGGLPEEHIDAAGQERKEHGAQDLNKQAEDEDCHDEPDYVSQEDYRALVAETQEGIEVIRIERGHLLKCVASVATTVIDDPKHIIEVIEEKNEDKNNKETTDGSNNPGPSTPPKPTS